MEKEELELIAKLRSDGLGYEKIAGITGHSRERIRTWCRQYNLERNTENDPEPTDYVALVNESGCRFVATGTHREGKKNYVSLVCPDCGSSFNRVVGEVATAIKRNTKMRCPICTKILKAERRAAAEAKKQDAQKKKEEKEKLWAEIRERFLAGESMYSLTSSGMCSTKDVKAATKDLYFDKICERCGKPYKTRRYYQRWCSRDCQNRDRRAEKEPRITLIKVIQMDRNICYLCGQPCDAFDCDEYEGGKFNAGDMYPTIDHVIPRSKGGRNSWSNVRLAHKRCNRIKKDKLLNFGEVWNDDEDPRMLM